MNDFIELISSQFEEQIVNLKPQSIISNTNGYDSLTAFSIIDAIEERYGIILDEEDLEKTVEEIFQKLK